MGEFSGEQIQNLPDTAISTMKEIIATAPKWIEQEMHGNNERWTSSFGTVATWIAGYFEVFKEESPDYSPKEYATVERNIDVLCKRLDEVRSVATSGMPPKEVRDELMAMLDVFRGRG